MDRDVLLPVFLLRKWIVTLANGPRFRSMAEVLGERVANFEPRRGLVRELRGHRAGNKSVHQDKAVGLADVVVALDLGRRALDRNVFALVNRAIDGDGL